MASTIKDRHGTLLDAEIQESMPNSGGQRDSLV
jgi:hypothetical protein